MNNASINNAYSGTLRSRSMTDLFDYACHVPYPEILAQEQAKDRKLRLKEHSALSQCTTYENITNLPTY